MFSRFAGTGLGARRPSGVDGANGDAFGVGNDFDLDSVGVWPDFFGGDFYLIAVVALSSD